MLIYTGWYIWLLVMIIFKGKKIIKGRKMDSCAAQSCSFKSVVVASPSLVLTPRGAVGMARVSQCWLVAEAHAFCHGRPLCPWPHLCASVPIAWGFGSILPFPWASPWSSHSPPAAPFCWQHLQELLEGFIHLPVVFRRFQYLTAYSRQT